MPSSLWICDFVDGNVRALWFSNGFESKYTKLKYPSTHSLCQLSFCNLETVNTPTNNTRPSDIALSNRLIWQVEMLIYCRAKSYYVTTNAFHRRQTCRCYWWWEEGCESESHDCLLPVDALIIQPHSTALLSLCLFSCCTQEFGSQTCKENGIQGLLCTSGCRTHLYPIRLSCVDSLAPV